jgi:hypothetical protein
LDRRLYVPPEVTDFRSLRNRDLPEATGFRKLRSYDPTIVGKPKPYDPTIVGKPKPGKPNPTELRVFARTSEHTETRMTRSYGREKTKTYDLRRRSEEACRGGRRVNAALDRRLYVPPEVTDFRSLRNHDLLEATGFQKLRSYDPMIVGKPKTYDPTIVGKPKPYDRRKTKPYGTPCVCENVGTHGNPDDTIVWS